MSRIRCTRSADFNRVYRFPMDVTGYSASLSISQGEDTGSLLTIGESANVNGSRITATGKAVSLLLKAADLAELPPGSPWNGIYQARLTSPGGIVTRFDQDNIEVGGAI